MLLHSLVVSRVMMTCKHTRDVAWVGLLDELKLWLLNFLLDGRSQNFNLPAVCCKGDFFKWNRTYFQRFIRPTDVLRPWRCMYPGLWMFFVIYMLHKSFSKNFVCWFICGFFPLQLHGVISSLFGGIAFFLFKETSCLVAPNLLPSLDVGLAV